MTFDTRAVIEYLPLLLDGVATSLRLIAVSLCIGTCLGAFLCLARMGATGPARAFAVAYISLMRGLPETVIVFLIYYGGPFVVSVRLSGFQSGVISLGLPFAAFAAEVFRTGLNAIAGGQLDAARALGLRPMLVLRLVWIPQAVRVAVPPFFGIVTILIKNSALVSAIGVEELFYQGSVLASRDGKYLEMITIVALLYFALIFPLSLGVRCFGRFGLPATGRS